MRVIASKRNKQTGEMFHCCPKSQGTITFYQRNHCHECATEGGGWFEELPAGYRVHCPYGEAVKVLVPSHVEDGIPLKWGDNKFALEQYTIMEPKLDGVRCIMLVTETGIRCFSRRNDKFGDQSEFTENVPHIARIKLPGLAGTILDGEIIVEAIGASVSGSKPTGTLGATMSVVGADPDTAIKTQMQSGYARVYVFDMPKLRDVDMTKDSWQTRHTALEHVFGQLLFSIKEYVRHFLY